MCALCLLCTFGRFVTREHFGRAHAPLLVIKTYEHLCVCLVPSLYVRSSCDEGAFWACPCTSPSLKDVRALVIVFSSPSLYVRSSCDEGAFRACPCTSPPHKDKRAFVFVFSPPFLVCSATCDKSAFGRAHAPLLLIKAHEHS